MQVTIELPDLLQQRLRLQAEELNISLETLIVQFLAQSVAQVDTDDEPKEEILARLRRSLEDAKAGRVRPISELWDELDDEDWKAIDDDRCLRFVVV